MNCEHLVADKDLRARILLYSDASVHLCLNNYTTYYCSASGLRSFLSSPTVFLATGIQECESTNVINPRRATLSELPGVTLASFSANGVLSVYFPEILQVVFSDSDSITKHKKLNLSAYLDKQAGSFTSKTYLLKYYLDFVKAQKSNQLIKQKVDINEETFFSIMREIFNSTLSFEPPAPPVKSLAEQLNDLTEKTVYGSGGKIPDKVTVSEYAAYHGLDHPTVRKLCQKGKFKSAEKEGNKYYLDLNEPLPTNEREKTKAPKQKKNSSSGALVFEEKDWPKEKVKNYIIENNIYSFYIADLIYSKAEVDIYHKVCDMREVVWDKQRYLIMRFDFDMRDSEGRSNLERMRNGSPPLVCDPYDPDAEPKEAVVHHIGQTKVCYATIDPFVHSKYDGVFHPFKPKEDNHDSIFRKIKRDFWVLYAKNLDKYGSFEGIPFIFPK